MVAVGAILAFGALAGPSLGATDMRGTWTVHANWNGTDYPQAWVIASSDPATGVFAGASNKLDPAGSPGARFGRIDGTISGAAVHVVNPYDVGTYSGTFDGVLSADGAIVSGHWTSNTGQAGSFTATRPSSKRPVGMQVTCNTGPSPLDPATCTAQVGDAGPAPNTTAPSGLVGWTATTGVLDSATCSLVATPSSPTVASCSVTYRGGVGGIHPGTALPVAATYAGDATFAPAGASHQLLSGVPQAQDLCAPADCSALGVRLPVDLDPTVPLRLALTDFCDLTGGCTGDVTAPLTAEQRAQLEKLQRTTDDALKDQGKRWREVREVQQKILQVQEEVTRTKANSQRRPWEPADVYIRGFIDNAPPKTVAAFDRSLDARFPPTGAASASREEAVAAKIVSFRLVLLAVASPTPTRASAKAFDAAVAQATSPTPGRARAAARLTLEAAGAIGPAAVLRDLRSAKGARKVALTRLATATLRLASGGHRAIALTPNAFGARVLRLLRIQALHAPVTLSLRLTGGSPPERTVASASIVLRRR